MRLKTLKIHNIASIENAEIDFDGSKFSGQELFLICGPTGAGKTTILDAICLALFDNTPRIENTRRNQSINFDQDLTNKDSIREFKSVLNLVRKNAVEATVILTFDGVDGRAYTATWRVYRKGQYRERKKTETVNGCQRTVRETYVASTFKNLPIEEQLSKGFKKEWTLTNDEGEDTIKGVDDAIIEAIGMTFEQFCKTTMLAQGEFTRFLLSTSEDKAEILEKLVGTEEYSRVGRIINLTANAKKGEVEALSRELADAIFLTDEQKQTKTEEISTLTYSIADKGKEKDAAERKLQWLRDSDKAIKAERQTGEQLAHADLKLASEETTEHKRLINLWDTTTEVRSALVRKSQCIIANDENKHRENDLAQRYDAAVAAMAHISEERDTEQKALETFKEYIDSQTQYDSMYSNAQTICSANADIISNTKYIDDNSPKIKEYEQHLAELLTEIEKLNAEKDSHQKSIAELSAKADKLKKTLTELGADMIDREIAELNAHISKIIAAENALTQYNEAKDEYSAKATVVQETEGRQKEYAEKECTVNEQYMRSQAVADESRRIYERTKDAISDHAKALRAELHAGDQCPVCGRTIEHIMNEEGFVSALGPLKDKMDADEKYAKNLAQEHAGAKAAHDAAKREVEKAQKEKNLANSKLDKKKKALQTLCEELSIDVNADITDALNKLREQDHDISTDLTRRQTAIRETRSQAETIHKEIERIRVEHISIIDKKIAIAQNDFGNIQRLKSELLGSLVKARQAIDEKRDKIRELINPEWHPADESTYYVELEAAAEKYAKAKKDCAEIEAKIKSLNDTLTIIGNMRAEVVGRFGQWSTRPLLPAIKTKDAIKLWTAIQRDANTLATTIAANAEALSEAETTIGAYCDSHPDTDIETVRSLLTIQSAEIQHIKDKVSQLVCDRERIKGEHDAAVKAVADLGSTPLAEGETAETLILQSQKLDTERQECAKRIGTIQQELDNDTLSRKLHSDKKAALDVMQAEYAEWDVLNKYLGNTDGKNFRNVAQSFILSDLLDKANAYLANITGRYSLFCNPGTLTIMLRDAYQGGAERPTNTLSGGESFIVSLSLALGLSSMQSVALEVDTLFIDEGFGTLSPEYLEPVIEALRQLYHKYHRRVGIISHVDTLRSRIPVIVEVTRHGSSKSTVEVTRQ